MLKATIFDIIRGSFVDGPGIRTTVFLKGCNLKCAWCHNPESQNSKPEMMFYKDKCVSCGKCKAVCPTPKNCTLCGRCEIYCPQNARKVCGKEYTTNDVFDEIIKDKSFYDNSGGGVTFSGGEPMLQIDFLVEILKLCKENKIHTAIDTAGNLPFEYFDKILPYTDLFLYDIKMLDNANHKKFIGVGNHLILENFKKLLELSANVWIRIPVIAEINANQTEMKNIKDFLKKHGKPQKIELLPYHSMGENKYLAIGKDSCSFSPPDSNQLAWLREFFNDL